MDRKLRELGLLAATLGAAIEHDTKLFAPIREYGRRLTAIDIGGFNRGMLDDLALAADRVDVFFEKYRSTPDSGFYLEPAQITGSDDDLRRLRQLIAELEPLEDSVLVAMRGPGNVGRAEPALSIRPRKPNNRVADLSDPAPVHPLFKRTKLGPAPKRTSRQAKGSSVGRPRVFVVHGHDHAVLDAVARFLTSVELDPVILVEQPNAGRTIIEKFEDYADVVFAVVVMSPDDIGAASGAPSRPRARQNVILELGFFIGRLGRERVAALRVGEIEEPADVRGVGYIAYDPGGAWKVKLGRELQAAGIAVDLNNLV